MAKHKKMSNKKPAQNSLIARAYMLSFPQLVLWAIVFASIGGLTVWRGNAAKAPSGSCYYSTTTNGGVVAATGLPTNTVVNFLTHDNVTGSQTGWVLGVTTDSTWSVNVPVPAHTTTYDFVSKTWGKNGSKYSIFAECTQNV